MYLAALILTIIGWAFQLYETLVKRTRNINVVLPIAYFVACLLFGISSLMTGDWPFALLDLVVAVLAAIIFMVLLQKKRR